MGLAVFVRDAVGVPVRVRVDVFVAVGVSVRVLARVGVELGMKNFGVVVAVAVRDGVNVAVTPAEPKSELQAPAKTPAPASTDPKDHHHE